MDTRIKQTSRRRRGRLVSRRRLPAVACLYLLLLLQAAPACALQQRPRTAAVTASTGAAPWGDGVADLVRFPSEEVAFIAGPQLKSGSPLNPTTWFDQTAVEKGLQHGEAFPADPPYKPLTGTVMATASQKRITGSGTRFLSELRPGSQDHIVISGPRGGRFQYVVSTIESDTVLNVSVAVAPGAAGSGLAAGRNTGEEQAAYDNLNYYDQALVQYVNCYRTGEARFCGYARKIADSWWRSGGINEGRTPVEESLAPRSSSLAGLMLRALDNRPEMFPWITEYVRQQLATWVERPLKLWYRRLSDAQLRGDELRPVGEQMVRGKVGFYFGVRDGGYMLLHAANLARVHPDPAVRAELRAKVLDAAVNYYARLQRLQSEDGGFYFELDGMEGLTTQPFQEGILAEGLIQVHRLTGDETVKQSILKLAEHLWHRAYNKTRWRAFYYFVGGKFTDGTSCANGCGVAASPWPPSDMGQVAEARQLNPTAVHTFGYAYLISGDPKFKTWGDEVFDSSYAGRDGFRSLAGFRAKEYDEAYRSAGKYLAWRLAHGNTKPGAAAGAPPESSVAPTGPAPAANSETSAAPVASASGEPSALVSAAQAEALRLSSGGALSAEALRALLGQIESARRAVDAERERLLTPAAVLTELAAAADHARTALRVVTASGGAGDDARLRLDWAAARLKRAGDRLRPREGQ